MAAARNGRSSGRPFPHPAANNGRTSVFARITLITAMATFICAASARADSVDGKPTHPDDRHVPASVRGSPSILFEDIYVRGSEPKYIRGRTPDENFYFAQ